MELSKGEYVSTTMMSIKDIFGNWTKHHMWGLPSNEQTYPFKQVCHALLEEIFDALEQAKVFSTLDLQDGYSYQLPLREGDKVKMTFWGIGPCGKDFGNFNHLVWKILLWNSKESWTKCWQALVLSNVTLMTSLLLI